MRCSSLFESSSSVRRRAHGNGGQAQEGLSGFNLSAAWKPHELTDWSRRAVGVRAPYAGQDFKAAKSDLDIP
jgi:hypothetical protein